VKELQRQASPNIVIALAGNKSDLADKRMVETEVCCVLFAELLCSLGVLSMVPVVAMSWKLLPQFPAPKCPPN